MLNLYPLWSNDLALYPSDANINLIGFIQAINPHCGSGKNKPEEVPFVAFYV